MPGLFTGDSTPGPDRDCGAHGMEVSMKRRLYSALLLIVCSACSRDMPLTAPSPTPSSALDLKPSVPASYRAHMSGDQVVPPRDTLAQGEAIFQLNRERTELFYRI